MECEITETTELLGVLPYQIEYDEWKFPLVECNIKGNVITQMVGHGFSYWVAPVITHDQEGLPVSMYGRIRYSGGRERSLDEIRELTHDICLFFEILAGEMITVGDFYLKKDDKLIKVIGLCNFPKRQLQRLHSSFDSRAYLRQSVFKVSDFGDGIGCALTEFYKIKNENLLAFEAYKQILLDEEVQISTYNMFLKAMQVVEGFQRSKIGKEEKLDFDIMKAQIMEKLDEEEKNFVKKYTTNNGENFRKCIKQFTRLSLQIVSGLSCNLANKLSDTVIRPIVDDRDVYTHASKEKSPVLPIYKLQAISYCYKSFFRILLLREMGLSESIIRKRLLFDRKFVAYYRQVFDQQIKHENEYGDTGDFDRMMRDIS